MNSENQLPTVMPDFDQSTDAIHNERPIRIICVGAGASGLCLAYKLQRSFRNFTLTIYEKNARVSGTWVENVYPGCACDIPAHNYTYSFEPKPDWPSVYASSSEIARYFTDFSTKYSLNRYIKLSHEVVKAQWSEADGVWSVLVRDLASGQVFENSCHVLIYATGYLNNAKWPTVEGLDKFRGPILHTAKWDPKIDLDGKNVGVIGNGPSGVQVMPAIQPVVKTLTAFVRSPIWAIPYLANTQRAYSDEEIDYFTKNPAKHLALRKSTESTMNSLFSLYLRNSRLQTMLRALCSKQMKEQFGDDNASKNLIPDYSVGCSRLSPNPGYFETLTKNNVTTVHSAVTALTEGGCRCENGQEYPVDVLICATGFDTSYRPRFPILGPHGRNLQDAWHTEPRCYMGIAADGFPNFCMTLGPFSPVAAGPVIPAIETQIDHILQILDRYQTESIHSFQPSSDAVTDFLAHVATVMPRTVWSDAGCRSSFKHPHVSANDTSPRLWPGSLLHYMEALRELRAEDWTFSYRRPSDLAGSAGGGGNRFAYLGRAGLSQAEFDPSCDLAYYIRATDDDDDEGGQGQGREGRGERRRRGRGSRAARREALTRSGTQAARELHMPLRRDPDAIVLPSQD